MLLPARHSLPVQQRAASSSRAIGRSCRLVVRSAASSGQGSASTSKGSGAGSQQQAIRTASLLTPSERKVLAESVAGVLQQPVSSSRAPETAQGGANAATEELVWLFSFGQNMQYDMVSRRDVAVASRDPAFVVDPRVRLVFKHRGGQATLEALPPGVEPRFRPLTAAQGQPCVHGVLYRMPASAVKQLHSRDQGYVLTQMEVETYDGVRVMANVFVSGPLAKLPQEVVPPESYLRRLREGAGFNFLDPLYQAWLSSIETVPSAGLGSEYFNTPGRYISYSLLLMSFVVVGGYLIQHW